MAPQERPGGEREDRASGKTQFSYTDLLPLGADSTSYRRLAGDGVTSHGSFGRKFLEIEPQVLTMLTAAAMHDIAHLLRPAHLRQLRSILEDP
ncbi:MAG TPA: hypothetical protein VED20_14655, partial [Streptosporangiaceae bacterium]|nr:hypothetical protein [Streptosporangiaceae bacterium]